MSSFLLWTDPHFTDNPIDEYRWDIFASLAELCFKYEVDEIVCLGDVVDRKDRHTGLLVNRLVQNFTTLKSVTNTEIKIISGNHEKPVTGPYFWEFFNKIGIDYLIYPLKFSSIWYLPFSANPVEEWKDLDLASASVILMHQTGQGARVEGDRELTSNNLPKFPNIQIFSGDVHRPQEVEGITYIGTPHPVRFSETWNNRVIVIEDDNFKKPISVWLPSIKRAIVDITSSKELDTLSYKEGDQVRVRYTISGKKLADWPEEQEAIRKWAKSREVYIASLEPKFIGDGVQVETNTEALALELMSPDEIVIKFGKDEKLTADVIEVGRQLLK